MRLLNARTLTFIERHGEAIPPYAILSHVWEDEEVTLQNMQADRKKYKRLKGFAKIQACCRQALEEGLEWAWVDTCCIDKTSSAELSEAINSMYRWYQQAEVCFAYLSDVPPSRGPVPDLAAFRKARWFSRGWCLQELIAPRELEFFAEDWTEIGTKNSLRLVITQVTGIPDGVLRNSKIASFKSAAERMSWASGRQTSREEDVAYCLFGLFDVNLPLLYGEGGTKAFLRLQEEILKRTLDLSLLLWSYEFASTVFPDSMPTGALCEHPCYFAPKSLRTISDATFSYSDIPLASLYPESRYIGNFKPPQIVGNYLNLTLMTAPFTKYMAEQPGSELRLASIARPVSRTDSPQRICILLSRGPLETRRLRIRNLSLELEPEASFASGEGVIAEEIHLRLYEDLSGYGSGALGLPKVRLGSTLQLHISARCKVPHDELVVAEALVSAKDVNKRWHRLVTHPFDRGNDSFRQDNMILLNESTTHSTQGFSDSKVAIRFLVRSRATSATKIAAVLVLHRFGSFLLERHWALRTWEAERPLDEASFEPFILKPETALEAGIVLDTSGRTVIWISKLGQCLEISRRRRLDKYFLQLVLSRCDWAGPYPAGAQELRLRPRSVNTAAKDKGSK